MRRHRDLRLLAALTAPILAESLEALRLPVFNPDDCVTCEHRHEPQGGHCYMFKEPPTTKCGQYRKDEALSFGDAFAQREGEVEVK